MENHLLEKAVQYLYGQGIIKKDKDIADKTGYNKATVSSYISGKIHPSLGFINSFEKVFNVKLDDFQEGGEKDYIKHPDAMQLISENVLLLKAELQTNRQLMIEVLAAVTNRSVTEVQMIAEKSLSHNITKILHELKQENG
jgi:transcriptional regulator with XRE-family HTH domain